MTLTCIINQLDLRAGTKGAELCISPGKDKVAKAVMAIATGVVTTPTKRLLLIDSAIKWAVVTPQARKNRDS